MICRPCAVAADWIPARSLYRDAPPGFVAEQRIEGHGLCVGAGSCACQHRVAPEKLSEKEEVDG